MYSGEIKRLTSVIFYSAMSSNVISLSPHSLITAPRFPEFGYVAVIGLILFLSLKELLSGSNIWEKDMECSLNMGIVPLLISLSAMVVYKLLVILVSVKSASP